MTLRIARVAALLGAVFAATAVAQEAPPSRPPNIVLFYVDDLGWTDLGCMGSGYYETPAVDRLAREGVLFTDAYANAPNCAPRCTPRSRPGPTLATTRRRTPRRADADRGG